MSLGNEALVISPSRKVKLTSVQFNTAAVTAPAEKNAEEFTAYHFTQSNNTETSSSHCDAVVLQSNNRFTCCSFGQRMSPLFGAESLLSEGHSRK